MKLFPTEKKESLKKKLLRLLFNLTPVIRGTGAWLTFLSDDWMEAHVRLPLSLRTRNYVGTIFGGAMFSAADPWYMVMLYQLMDKSYIIWDKSAHIRFINPGKGKLSGRFLIEASDLDAIQREVKEKGETEYSFILTWMDKEDKAVAKVEKLVYIADKSYYKKKRKLKKIHSP